LALSFAFTGSKLCGHSVESGGEIAAKKERGVGDVRGAERVVTQSALLAAH